MRLPVTIRAIGETLGRRARALFSWPPHDIPGPKATLLFILDSKIVMVLGNGNGDGGWAPVSSGYDRGKAKEVEFVFSIRKMERGTYELAAYSKDGDRYYDDEELDTLDMVFSRALELYEIDPEDWKSAT